MPEIFNTLPGLEVPVGGVGRSLARMWTDNAADGRPAPEADDARATQVNFVLHLGLKATPEDAAAQFATVVRFSQRYPGRVVVLCPLHADVPEPVIRAKIYGECFLGRSKSDKRCVEFVMLSYSRSARPFLEDQVSICLSTDLPLYYWAHRFSASGRLADYRYLLGQAKRVLLDSAIAPADALTYPWPNPGATRDLAFCRLLPVRQSVGQFLSAYPAGALVEGLREVTVAHGGELAAEGRVLLGWLRERLDDCGEAGGRSDIPAKEQFSPGGPASPEAGHGISLASSLAGHGFSVARFGRSGILPAAATSRPSGPAAVEARVTGLGGERQLAIAFNYEGEAKRFQWRGDLANGQAVFEADFGAGRTTLSAGVSLLAPEAALSEAMFF